VRTTTGAPHSGQSRCQGTRRRRLGLSRSRSRCRLPSRSASTRARRSSGRRPASGRPWRRACRRGRRPQREAQPAGLEYLLHGNVPVAHISEPFLGGGHLPGCECGESGESFSPRARTSSPTPSWSAAVAEAQPLSNLNLVANRLLAARSSSCQAPLRPGVRMTHHTHHTHTPAAA
jgi:hypothetical protein